ncbi:MAG: ABC transporter ATP-binding protein [Actinomycetota bacterium]|nr:ABC transporter ATP-binding protein [Actinomycetota bacterium]
MAVIEVEGLRKEYRRFRKGRTVALDGLDLTVPEGGVFGFLGPNGAGKTTTIRCLLGLIAPSSGTCRILGATPPRELPAAISKVGAIVETPTMFPGFSGRRNLELLGATYGIGRRAVDDVLEKVGLTERGGDRVKTYSLGMKQRLGIGAALLKDPELLILDEPANGLDPAGIKEVRELVRLLGSEGRTVFVSSHILPEVKQMCDRVAILARGRCVAAGPVEEVLSRDRASGLLVRVDDQAQAISVLREAGMAVESRNDLLSVEVPASQGAQVTRALAERGIYLSEMRSEEVDLETVFLKLTTDEPRIDEDKG